MKKKEKKYPARSYKGILKKIFWSGFFCVLFLSIISIIRTVNLADNVNRMGKEINAQDKILKAIPREEKGEPLIINEEGAKLFACDFAKEFYTWGYGEKKEEERAERLQSYLLQDVDKAAGYDISRLNTSSSVRDCRVYEISTSDKKIEITVKVNYVLTEQVMRKKKAVDKVISEEARFLKILVVTDGSSYKVANIPCLVQIVVNSDFEHETFVEDSNLLVTDENLCDEISSFMETYYKMSTTANTEELQYYTTSDVQSMSGLYEYVMIDNINIYQADKGYRVYSSVRMQDASTKAETILYSVCRIAKEKDRYVVTEIEY